MDTKYEFTIKNAKWQRNTFFILIAIGLAASAVTFILWLALGFDWGILVGVLFIAAIEVLVGGLGLFVWYREEFRLEQGVFTYVFAFRKRQSAALSDVARVEFSVAYAFPRVTFVGKNGERLLWFSDDGTSLKGNRLIGVLMHYNIPIVRK